MVFVSLWLCIVVWLSNPKSSVLIFFRLIEFILDSEALSLIRKHLTFTKQPFCLVNDFFNHWGQNPFWGAGFLASFHRPPNCPAAILQPKSLPATPRLPVAVWSLLWTFVWSILFGITKEAFPYHGQLPTCCNKKGITVCICIWVPIMVELTVCRFFLFWQHLATHIFTVNSSLKVCVALRKLFRTHAYTIHHGGGTKKEYLWSFYKISAMAGKDVKLH